MTVDLLIGLIVVLPLGGAATALLLRRYPRSRDSVVVLVLLAVVAMSALLLTHVVAEGSAILRVGGWAPDLGIVLVADLFAALVLLVAMGTIFVVELFAIGQRRTRWGADPELAGPLILVLTTGVALSMLTGDLFTLFVAFELILVSSYVLLTHRGNAGQVRSGMTYVVMNLFASALFLIGVAIVYRATGSVNFARIAARIPDLDPSVAVGIGLWFLMVFGTKAALFPVFSWLPDSYPTAPTSVTAVFAGLLTKVGVYVLIRFHTLTDMVTLRPVMLAVAALTMLIGVLGALAQNDVKRILSFHIISQIGYMLMGLGLFTVAGVAGAVLFLIHHMPVKTMLFLTGGLIEEETGTSRLGSASGLIKRSPMIAVLFAIPALSLAGLPPFSGFVAKLAIIDAGVQSFADPSAIAMVVVAVSVSALTLASMTKIWLGVFWGEARAETAGALLGRRRTLLVGATSLGVAMTLVIAASAGSLWELSERAAEDLLSPDSYVADVLGLATP